MCSTVNLPAFESADAAKAFYGPTGSCPSFQITKIWQCENCGNWHVKAHGSDPSGQSSGTSSRQDTLRIRPDVEAHNEEMSRPGYVSAVGRRWDKTR